MSSAKRYTSFTAVALVVAPLAWAGCDESPTAGKGSGTGAAAGDKADPPGDPDSLGKRVEDEIVAKAGPAATGAAAGEFGVESAKITFRHSGMEEGTVTAWIDGHGAVVVLDYDMTKPMAVKKRSIWKDGKTTMWSSENKKVQITRLRPRDTEMRLISTTDPKQLGYAGYVKKPSEKVAGKDCEVWYSERQNVTVWRWNRIDLKYENRAVKGVANIVEATSVETPVELPAELFEYPDGYEVKNFAR